MHRERVGKREGEKGKEEKWNEKRGLQGSGEEAGAAGDVRPFFRWTRSGPW